MSPGLCWNFISSVCIPLHVHMFISRPKHLDLHSQLSTILHAIPKYYICTCRSFLSFFSEHKLNSNCIHWSLYFLKIISSLLYQSKIQCPFYLKFISSIMLIKIGSVNKMNFLYDIFNCHFLLCTLLCSEESWSINKTSLIF